MRDLVETVIGQVLKRQPVMKPQGDITPTKVSLKEHQAPNTPGIRDEKLWGACCQFEAIFLQQMMQAMRKTVPESDFLPRGYADGVYDGMMDQAIAESGSKQAPLGLAKTMYRQLEQQANPVSAQDILHAADNLKVAPTSPHPGEL